ncbi:hypothetical protein MJT46_014120 [Ovis ammon polii x Ovis aries]|nr:hypothetical protein MJT46_014120 [Ovis ammon polii x Ovis aries]
MLRRTDAAARSARTASLLPRRLRSSASSYFRSEARVIIQLPPSASTVAPSSVCSSHSKSPGQLSQEGLLAEELSEGERDRETQQVTLSEADTERTGGQGGGAAGSADGAGEATLFLPPRSW